MYNVAGESCRNGTAGTRKVAMAADGSFRGDVLEYPVSGGGFEIRGGGITQFPSTTLKTSPVGAIGEQF